MNRFSTILNADDILIDGMSPLARRRFLRQFTDQFLRALFEEIVVELTAAPKGHRRGLSGRLSAIVRELRRRGVAIPTHPG